MLIIFLYIAVVAIGCFFIFKTLAPEFNLKISLPNIKFLGLGRPHLMKDVSANVVAANVTKAPLPVVAPIKAVQSSLDIPTEEVYGGSKSELLLAEKNREIAHLKDQLLTKQRQGDDFEKLKSILDEEIVKLREQNRTLKSELALLNPAQSIKNP